MDGEIATDIADEVEQIATQIRAFAESVDQPDLWRVLIPVDAFDDVTDRLETEYDVGTSYEDITLCYTQHHDEARVEYMSPLDAHLQAAETDGDHDA